MGKPVAMTPDENVAKIRDLVTTGLHAEVLAFSEEQRDSVEPPLSPYQTLLVADTLHVSAMIVAMEESAAAHNYTLRGDPDDMLQCVVSVVPVEEVDLR